MNECWKQFASILRWWFTRRIALSFVWVNSYGICCSSHKALYWATKLVPTQMFVVQAQVVPQALSVYRKVTSAEKSSWVGRSVLGPSVIYLSQPKPSCPRQTLRLFPSVPAVGRLSSQTFEFILVESSLPRIIITWRIWRHVIYRMHGASIMQGRKQARGSTSRDVLK